MTDLEKLRTQLRGLSRGDLLIIAERAAEQLPEADLKAILGDFMDIEALMDPEPRHVSLIEAVRKFCLESRGGHYFDCSGANAKDFMARSRGTDAFIAEFNRLQHWCLRAVDARQHDAARQSFELLFELLRRIDENPDEVVFFADEAGSWQIGVHWRTVLPAYFRCLAEKTSAEDYAARVDQVIRAFADHDRPWHLNTAQAVASDVQQVALRARCGTSD